MIFVFVLAAYSFRLNGLVKPHLQYTFLMCQSLKLSFYIKFETESTSKNFDCKISGGDNLVFPYHDGSGPSEDNIVARSGFEKI